METSLRPLKFTFLKFLDKNMRIYLQFPLINRSIKKVTNRKIQQHFLQIYSKIGHFIKFLHLIKNISNLK